MRTLALLPALVLCASCVVPTESSGGGGTSGGEAFTASCRGDFGASAAAAEFEAFMDATYRFHEAADEVSLTLLDACVAMGRELQMDPAQLAGSGVEATRDVCRTVTTFMGEEYRAVAEASETTVELRSRPPMCEASFEAYAECAGRCDIEVTPAEMELRCRGGEIRGVCQAECSGSCAVSVNAQCTGICEGICEGTCSNRKSDGSCGGACDGTCRGQCVADVTGSCGGQCRGRCSVEWQEPYCTGRYNPPEVNADCQAACQASVDARLECTPGEAELIVSGGPDAATLERAARVRRAVDAGLATVITARARLDRLERSGQDLVRSLERLPSSIRTVGISAAACSAAAVADLQRSLRSISISVEVTVSVSASVQAG